MDKFPLYEFLQSLAFDGLKVPVSDYDRLARVFQTTGKWTPARFKHVMVAVLAHDLASKSLIQGKLEKLINEESKLEKEFSETDIQGLLEDLRKLKGDPIPLEDHDPDSDRDNKKKDVAPPPQKPITPIWWAALTLLTLGGLIYWAFFGDGNKSEASTIIKKECLDVFPPDLLFFGRLGLGKSTESSIVLTNNCDTALTVQGIKLRDGLEKAISIVGAVPDQIRLAPSEKKEIKLLFNSRTEGEARDTLQFQLLGQDSIYKIALAGIGRSAADPKPQTKRLVRNAPFLKGFEAFYDQLASEEWKSYAVISGVLFLLLLLYGWYLWRLLKGPNDKAPKVDEKAALHYDRSTIGGKPQPRIKPASLSYLSDLLGYFQSDQAGKRLDIKTSVKRTLQMGSFPVFEFWDKKMMRTLLILEDGYSSTTAWNPIATELAVGLDRQGVPVVHGKFFGSLKFFKTPDGVSHDLDDWDGMQTGAVVLLFTDGRCFHRASHRFDLEILARWPSIAWMNLDISSQDEDSRELAHSLKIPIYPATEAGIEAALRGFLTENGTSSNGAANLHAPTSLLSLSWADTNYDVWLEYQLGDALPLAQDCSILQPCPYGLADAIRRKFYPAMPIERLDRILALPKVELTGAGIRFPKEQMVALRTGLRQRGSEQSPDKVLDFILEKVNEAEPAEPRDSLAYLSWEALRERLALEKGQGDLKRLGELNKSVLGAGILDSLEGFGMEGTPGKIPLVNTPTHEKALARLHQWFGSAFGVPNINVENHFSLFTFLLGVFVFHFFMFLSMYNNRYNQAINIKITSPKSIYHSIHAPVNDSLVELNLFAKDSSQLFSPYAGSHILSMYGSLAFAQNIFDIPSNGRVELEIGSRDTLLPCEEKDPTIGLTTIRCPSSYLGSEPYSTSTWRGRLGALAPQGRTLSIGIEFMDGQPEDYPLLEKFRNSLLETNSIDLLYRIQPVGDSNSWEIKKAIDRIMADNAPWWDSTQIIGWSSGNMLNQSLINYFNEKVLNRLVRMPATDPRVWAPQMLKLFEPGEKLAITELDIKKALGKDMETAEFPLTLVGRLSRNPKLWLNLNPGFAKVDIQSSNLAYEPGIALPPGPCDLLVTAPGYDTLLTSFVLRQDTSIDISLKKTPLGTLVVQTNPIADSIVVEDGRGKRQAYLGNGQAISLLPGPYTVTAHKAGHEPSEVTTRIKGQETNNLVLDLQPYNGPTATLLVIAKPETAKLRLKWEDANGKARSLSLRSGEKMKLQPGRRLLSATSGRRSRDTLLNLAPNGNHRIILDLNNARNGIFELVDEVDMREHGVEGEISRLNYSPRMGYLSLSSNRKSFVFDQGFNRVWEHKYPDINNNSFSYNGTVSFSFDENYLLFNKDSTGLYLADLSASQKDKNAELMMPRKGQYSFDYGFHPTSNLLFIEEEGNDFTSTGFHFYQIVNGNLTITDDNIKFRPSFKGAELDWAYWSDKGDYIYYRSESNEWEIRDIKNENNSFRFKNEKKYSEININAKNNRLIEYNNSLVEYNDNFDEIMKDYYLITIRSLSNNKITQRLLPTNEIVIDFPYTPTNVASSVNEDYFFVRTKYWKLFKGNLEDYYAIHLFTFTENGYAKEIPGFEGLAATSATFSPDGQYLTIGTKDSKLLIYKIKNDKR